MKRTLVALLLALGLVALPLQVAHAAPADQVKGNACADITADPNYTNVFNGVATAYADITTAKPSCAGVLYTMTVTDGAGTVLGYDEAVGDGGSLFQLAAVPTGGPSSVCLTFTSQTSGGKVIDLAPDAPDNGCTTGALFVLNGGTGGRVMK
jgi:hypothetical protein